MDSPIVDMAIGMVFTFAVVAALSAVLTELVARFLGLRARFLLLGLRELVDGDEVTTVNLAQAETTFTRFQELASGPSESGPHSAVAGSGAVASATEALLGSSIMRAQGMAGSVGMRDVAIVKQPSAGGRLGKAVIAGDKRWQIRKKLRSLPSYISSRSFSAAVVDLLIPDARDETTLTEIRQRVASIQEFPALTDQLESLLKSSEESVEGFRRSVEGWYDDHMARVSGWYKRHVAKWSLVLGALLVIVLNVNSAAIAQSLWTNEGVRTAVAAVATEATQCDGKAGAELDACLDTLADQLQQAKDAGLPIGWGVVPQCQEEGSCSFAERYGLLTPGPGFDARPLFVLFGWLLTILALVPGARFWFDLLGKLGSLRTTGPKPSAST